MTSKLEELASTGLKELQELMQRTGYYALDSDHQVIQCSNLDDWARRYRLCDRHVGLNIRGKYRVSTIFIGIVSGMDLIRQLEHPELPPLVFETMAWRGKEVLIHWRSASWSEAWTRHAGALAFVERLAVADFDAAKPEERGFGEREEPDGGS